MKHNKQSIEVIGQTLQYCDLQYPINKLLTKQEEEIESVRKALEDYPL